MYGTLLRGEANHHLLARATFVGAATTEPRFSLHDLGAYPAMVAGGAHAIVGEVYEVDPSTLAALDELEGHPRFYRRTPITLADGSLAETYLQTRSRTKGRPVLAAGSWRERR